MSWKRNLLPLLSRRPIRLFAGCLFLILPTAFSLFASGKADPAGKRKKKRQEAALRGRVGPDIRGPVFIQARTWLLIDLMYDRGRIIQKGMNLKRYSKRRSVRQYLGRYEVRLFDKKKKVMRTVAFEFPLVGAQATYTRQGAGLVRKIVENVQAFARVEVPWDQAADALVVWDGIERKAHPLVLLGIGPNPMCHVSPRKRISSDPGQGKGKHK